MHPEIYKPPWTPFEPQYCSSIEIPVSLRDKPCCTQATKSMFCLAYVGENELRPHELLRLTRCSSCFKRKKGRSVGGVNGAKSGKELSTFLCLDHI